MSSEYTDVNEKITYVKIDPTKYKLIRTEEIGELTLDEIQKKIDVLSAEVQKWVAIKSELEKLTSEKEVG